MAMEIEEILIRYIQIQTQEQALKEEKTRLQDRIEAHMDRTGQSLWFPVVEGQRLKVRCRKTIVVEYDEETLLV